MASACFPINSAIAPMILSLFGSYQNTEISVQHSIEMNYSTFEFSPDLLIPSNSISHSSVFCMKRTIVLTLIFFFTGYKEGNHIVCVSINMATVTSERYRTKISNIKPKPSIASFE